MIISVFKPSTGQIIHSVHVASEQQANTLYQHWLPGHWPNDQYWVVNAQPVLLPPRPASELPMRFDYATAQWETNPLIQRRMCRAKRNAMLTDIDQVNPVRYASLTADQQAELQAYRLALLAVPQQAGFPEVIEWPPKPVWL
jgi:hypothetical protein